MERIGNWLATWSWTPDHRSDLEDRVEAVEQYVGGLGDRIDTLEQEHRQSHQNRGGRGDVDT